MGKQYGCVLGSTRVPGVLPTFLRRRASSVFAARDEESDSIQYCCDEIVLSFTLKVKKYRLDLLLIGPFFIEMRED